MSLLLVVSIIRGRFRSHLDLNVSMRTRIQRCELMFGVDNKRVRCPLACLRTDRGGNGERSGCSRKKKLVVAIEAQDEV